MAKALIGVVYENLLSSVQNDHFFANISGFRGKAKSYQALWIWLRPSFKYAKDNSHLLFALHHLLSALLILIGLTKLPLMSLTTLFPQMCQPYFLLSYSHAPYLLCSIPFVSSPHIWRWNLKVQWGVRNLGLRHLGKESVE